MVVENIIEGAKKVLSLTKESLKDVENKPVGYKDTNYNLPTIRGLLGKEIKNLDELKEFINSLEVKEEATLENALDAGVLTLMCAEALETLKYATEEEPYKEPYVGFIPDKIIRDLGVPLVEGKIPAIFVVIGKVGDSEKLKKLIDDIKKRNILTLFIGDIVKELDEAGIEYGLDKLLVPVGEGITSAAHAANLAIRVPLIYGGIEPGKTEDIIDYIKNKVPAIVIALGEIDDITLSAGAGCIKAGVPVITNNPVPEIKGALESSDIDNIVENALKMKNIEVRTVTEMDETEIPVSVGPMNEGERVRGPDMHVELAGPKSFGFELVTAVDEASDEVKIIGKDIKDMEEGSRSPFAVIIRVSGDNLEEDLEGVLERRIHEFFNYIEGVMHLNQRDSVWIRVNKNAAKKGLSLQHIGKIVQSLYKAEFPFIKNIDVILITDEEEVKKELENAKQIYDRRDARARDLNEEDVDVFYGCIMCQSFAPTHICVITPNKPALCGGINYFDARAAAKIDPEGPIFEIPKGELIDETKGIYSTINEVVKEKSQGSIEEIALHSIMEKPSTSCGCFEAITFYIPEVDGFGIVHKDFKGETPMGVPFSALAGQCSGGKQVEGFCGMCIEYMRSSKFFQADGGWKRVVWMPSELKERVKESIPEELLDKIATEENVSDTNELQEFLRSKAHPIVESWTEMAEPEMEEAVEEAGFEGDFESSAGSDFVVPTMELPAGFGGLPSNFKIILKNAVIKAEKIIITKEDGKSKK